MPTPQKRRGLFSRTITRLVYAPLLLAALLIPQFASAAPSSFGSIDSVDSAKTFFNVDGASLPQTQYQVRPQTVGGPDQVKPKQISVAICARTGSTGSGQCTASSGDAQIFTFTRMHHEELGGGVDYWDYTFVAAGNSKLQFLYRKNPGGGSHWGLVYGETDTDADFSENKVVGLEKFNETDVAKNVLEAQADDDGLAWAKKGGIVTSTNQTGFLDRSDSDPFMKAVEKATEAINSLTETVSGALLWAIETSNPSETNGLSEAWMTVRDLVNTLFILVLAVLAVMTIARLDSQKYNVRSLLPMLVFAIITVNFSFIAATVLVNTAYVLSQPFLESAVGVVTQAGEAGAGFTGAEDFGTAIVLLLASLFLLIALAVLLFFFVVRIIVIWLLTALSPVVCLFMVLPLTRGESKKLLETGIRWVYMAPVSLLILYIGSRVAFPTSGQNETVDAFLTAIFYGGLVVAAVMLPMALGGRIMSMVASRGSNAAKLGGKGGLGAAGLIPAGNGQTVGQRVREGKAFMEQRKANLDRRAGLSAANAQLRLADGPLGSSITGMDEGIRTSMQDKMLADKEKELLPYNTSSKRRIAHAWQYGTVQDSAGVHALDNTGTKVGLLSSSEQALSRDRIAAGAAYKALAQSDLSELYMVDQPGIQGRTFAWTGGQQAHKGDPIITSYELNGQLNEQSMRIRSEHLDAEGVKGLDTTFLERAQNGDRLALDSLREIDEVRLGNAVDAEHRFKFSSAAKMRVMYDIANKGLLSRGLTGDAHREQRKKEEIIKNSFEYGQKQLRDRRA